MVRTGCCYYSMVASDECVSPSSTEKGHPWRRSLHVSRL